VLEEYTYFTRSRFEQVLAGLGMRVLASTPLRNPWIVRNRFRDQIALLEVDIVALEMMVLRVLSAEKSGKQSLDVAGLLKIRGSEIQQRYTELMMLAAGPFATPFIHEAVDAGWQGEYVGAAHCAPLAGTYFNMRKTTIYGGSNEVQRNIVAQTVLGS